MGIFYRSRAKEVSEVEPADTREKSIADKGSYQGRGSGMIACQKAWLAAESGMAEKSIG